MVPQEILDELEKKAPIPGKILILYRSNELPTFHLINVSASKLLGLPRVRPQDPPLAWSDLPADLAQYLTEAMEGCLRDPAAVPPLPVLEFGDPVKSAYSVKITHLRQELPDAEQHWFLFILSDVTSWLSLQEDVMNARRLESIGSLASGVAHDFNNLLMVVRGHADFISALVPDDESIHYSLDQIRQACQNGSGLTQSLLGFARKQSLIMQPLNFAALVYEVADLCRRSYGTRYQVHLDPTLNLGVEELQKQDNFMVHGCASALSHCLLNVLNNARDSMPEGGPIHLTHHLTPTHVALAIQDQGCGIDPLHLSRIFEPFFTTKTKGAGTGLGLSLALSIIKQHHGEIHVESQPGQGTTVTFVLPRLLSSPSEDHPPENKKITTGPVGLVQRAFLIDDDDMVRNAVAQLLELQKIKTEKFSRPQEALQRIRSGEFPSLLFVDYTMPEMDGITFLRQVLEILRTQATPPRMRLVLISGHPPDYFSDFIKEFEKFSLFLLQKPFSADDIHRILQSSSKKLLRRTTSRVSITPDMVQDATRDNPQA